MNQPDRYSRFVLPSGIDSAVTYKQDTKMKGAGQFDIWLEDHTLGNLLRQQLLTNPEVVFAGYRIPHPLNPMMVVRIQTTEQSNPPTAMMKTIDQLRAEVGQLQVQLDQAAPRDPAMQPQQPSSQQAYGYDPQYGAPAGGYGGYQPGGGGY